MALPLLHEVPSRAGDNTDVLRPRRRQFDSRHANIFFVFYFYSILAITDAREVRRHIEYGGSGHARLHRTAWLWVCPSTPASWSARSLFGMGRPVLPGGSQGARLPRNSHPSIAKKTWYVLPAPPTRSRSRHSYRQLRQFYQPCQLHHFLPVAGRACVSRRKRAEWTRVRLCNTSLRLLRR